MCYDIGTCATYISKWVTSIAHLHILFGSVSCDIQCHNHDSREIKGGKSAMICILSQDYPSRAHIQVSNPSLLCRFVGGKSGNVKLPSTKNS